MKQKSNLIGQSSGQFKLARLFLAIMLISTFFGAPLSKEAEAYHANGHTGWGWTAPGSLYTSSATYSPTNQRVSLSGVGVGGLIGRGRVFCEAGYAVGVFMGRLGSSTPTAPAPPVGAGNTVYNTQYYIDGSPVASYTLNLTGIGYNQPVNCGESGYQEHEYGYNFSFDASGLAPGNHTAKVSAWDEATSQVIYSPDISFTVGGGQGPEMVTRSVQSNLAVFNWPTVSLLGREAGSNDPFTSSVSLDVGQSLELSWSTFSVNDGDSCNANPNDDPGQSAVGWSGTANGPGGGTFVTSAFTTVGTLSLDVNCFGRGGNLTNNTSVNVSVGNAADIACSSSGAPVQVVRGGSRVDVVSVVPVQPYSPYNNDVVVESSISPSNGTPPVVSINPSGPTDVSTNQTHNFIATVSTDTGTTLGTYQITYTVRDVVTNQIRSCGTLPIEVIYNTPPVLNPPTNVRIDNSICQQMTVSWFPPIEEPPVEGKEGEEGGKDGEIIDEGKEGETPEEPEAPGMSFNIYRRTNTGAFTPADLVGSSNGSPFINSMASDGTLQANVLYYYGVSAVYGPGEESTVTGANNDPKVVNLCTANLDGSDKDVMKIGNRVTTGISACANGSEGPTSIVKSGDFVIFRICVRNSGSSELTNVVVTELPNENVYTRNLVNIQMVTSVPGEPGMNSTCAGSPSGNTWNIGNMPSTEPDTVCTIYVTATVADPSGPAGNLYRFQNIANITANSVNGSISEQVRSPLILFSKSSSAPDRNETTPGESGGCGAACQVD